MMFNLRNKCNCQFIDKDFVGTVKKQISGKLSDFFQVSLRCGYEK